MESFSVIWCAFLLVNVQFLVWKVDSEGVIWYEPTPVESTSDQAKELTPGQLRVYEGSSATLTWKYSLSSNFSSALLLFKAVVISLISNGKASPVGPDFRKRFSVSVSTPQSVSLLILNVTVADDRSNGDFICEVNDLTPAKWRRAIEVQVIVPLNITEIRGEPTVLEGENLQLICEVSSRIKPNITWTKEKPGNQGNTGVLPEGKELNIPNINRTDTGIFTCKANNGFGERKNQTVFVNVTYPAKIVKFQPEYIVVLQQSLTLNCEAEGNPPPSYTWTPCNDPEKVCDKNTLHISQVLNDTSYTSRVANVYGNDSKSANVYIGGNVINITIVITSEICIDGKYNQSLFLEKLKKPLEEAFTDKPGYEGVQLISMRCGSIIADLALKFNSTTKEQDVITTLNDAVKNGKLGEFIVRSIKGTRPDVEPTIRGTQAPTDDPTGGIAWWIIFIIVLLIIIILVLLGIFLKKKVPCSLPVNNGKHPRVHSNERQVVETGAGYDLTDDQYAAAGPKANYRASNQSSEPSVTYEVANRRAEGRRGNGASKLKEPLPEYAVVDKTKKKNKKPKPGELQYAELGELTGRGQKATMPRVVGTDTVYADIKS